MQIHIDRAVPNALGGFLATVVTRCRHLFQYLPRDEIRDRGQRIQLRSNFKTSFQQASSRGTRRREKTRPFQHLRPVPRDRYLPRCSSILCESATWHLRRPPGWDNIRIYAGVVTFSLLQIATISRHALF